MNSRFASNGDVWPQDCHSGIEDAIAEFRRLLPGWWYSLGECQVSCDASCSPTRCSPDIELIDFDRRFDHGFHVDLSQPSTLADALRGAMNEAIVAKREAMQARDRARCKDDDEHVSCYDRTVPVTAAAYDSAHLMTVHHAISKARGRSAPKGRALDVGAGAGRDARWLSSQGYQVTAVEPSKGMRGIGSTHQENGDITWIDARLPNLSQIARASQDLILVSAVWQHVSPSLREQAFDELWSVLAPRGILTMLTRHGPAPEGRPMHATDMSEIPGHARRIGIATFSSIPVPDVLGREDVKWVLWTLRKDASRSDRQRDR